MIKTYHCPSCKRNIDYVIKPLSPDLYRCIITKGCNGVLQYVSTKSGNISKLPAVTNLPDWIPRGISNTFNDITADFEYVNISSSFYNDIAILSPNNITQLTFKESSLINNKQDMYLYTLTGDVKTITGQDSTVSKNVLRINESDIVKVKVNGIETFDFEHDNSSITFVPKLTGYSYIEIFVIRFDETNGNEIVIYPNANITPWAYTSISENITSFNLSSFSSLKGYQLITDIEDGILLLSKSPFGITDQIDTHYIKCDVLKQFNITIQYDSNGYSMLYVPDIALTHLSRPLVYKKDNIGIEQTINIENETQQIKSSFIIGPN